MKVERERKEQTIFTRDSFPVDGRQRIAALMAED